MRWCVAVLLVSGVARAEPDATPLPFGALITAGIGTAGSGDRGYDPVTAIQLDVGVRGRAVMGGAHVSFSSGTPLDVYVPLDMYSYHYIYTFRPMQIGLFGHWVLSDRFFGSLWLGMQSGWWRRECTTTTYHGSSMPDVTTCGRGDWEFLDARAGAFGLGIGADLVEVKGHRLTATAAFSHAEFGASGLLYGNPNTLAYTTLWLGIGYRFWDR